MTEPDFEWDNPYESHANSVDFERNSTLESEDDSKDDFNILFWNMSGYRLSRTHLD